MCLPLSSRRNSPFVHSTIGTLSDQFKELVRGKCRAILLQSLTNGSLLGLCSFDSFTSGSTLQGETTDVHVLLLLLFFLQTPLIILAEASDGLSRARNT